ncbi:MAG TPA: glycosyltransferase family 2 protein [Pyrinomonadaceae bacterium]|nr:glycosyltransferase family 2 protein [Pyrinomonadaceae bacterium]
MKLSVVICTYNGAAYLPAQLESLAAQTRPPDELVVCDDCSTDETTALLRAFAAHAPFPVRLYVNERNLGSTKNFERAIELCTGALIALCDQDDIWYPNKLARSEAALAANPAAGLVFTDAEVIDDHTQPLGYRLWECVRFDPARRELFRRGRAFPLLLKDTYVTGTTLVFRAEFKELILPIPTEINIIHDAWIACLISAAADLIMIDEPLLLYRRHGSQQIGVPFPPAETQPGELDALRAGVRRRVAFEASIRDLNIIRDRLIARAGAYRLKAVMPLLEARIAHLQTRAALPARKLNRIPYVLRELLSWRYHNYSKGWLSAAKDLLC